MFFKADLINRFSLLIHLFNRLDRVGRYGENAALLDIDSFFY